MGYQDIILERLDAAAWITLNRWPSEFGMPVQHIVENPYLNATSISLDGGARMAAR